MKYLAVLRVSDLDDDQLLIIKTMNGAAFHEFLTAHAQHVVTEVVPMGRANLVTIAGGQVIVSLLIPASTPLRAFIVAGTPARLLPTGSCLAHVAGFWCGAPAVVDCLLCHTPLCAAHVDCPNCGGNQ